MMSKNQSTRVLLTFVRVSDPSHSIVGTSLSLKHNTSGWRGANGVLRVGVGERVGVERLEVL